MRWGCDESTTLIYPSLCTCNNYTRLRQSVWFVWWCWWIEERMADESIARADIKRYMALSCLSGFAKPTLSSRIIYSQGIYVNTWWVPNLVYTQIQTYYPCSFFDCKWETANCYWGSGGVAEALLFCYVAATRRIEPIYTYDGFMYSAIDNSIYRIERYVI